MTTTGHAVMTTLRNYGIDTIFGIPGTHNLELYRPLSELGIRAVTARHEQGAGYAADGWSQRTGRPGVVVTTSGPGLLNALSAAATAYCESRPMIILAPGPALGEEGADRGTLHETKDTLGAANAVVQWARRASTPREAIEAIHDAFTSFRTSRPRPIYLELPLDVLEGPADLSEEFLAAREAPEPRRADAHAIAGAVQALAGSSNPVVVAGGGSIAAGDQLRRLVELLDCPVVTTFNGKGAVAESHALSLTSGLGTSAAVKCCNDADVLIVVGSKLGDVDLWAGSIQPRGPIVRIDILESQMGVNLTSDIRLVGDSAAVVPQLVEALEAASVTSRGRGASEAAKVRAEIEAELQSVSPAMVRLTRELVAGMPKDTVLAADSSQVTYHGTSSIRRDEPNTFLYMATYSTLGYGLPAAIGAKIAAPERPLLCVVGDGALMFSVQEIATAVEQELDLVIVCVDNGGYGEIRQNQADRGIPAIAVDLHQPEWAALGRAFGAHGCRPETGAELGPKVAAAFATGGVHLIHVPVELFD
jgi:5-guanidino-2-oxopentanoate decarboxylase